MTFKCVVMFLLTLSLTVSPLLGQMDRGTINGTVKDTSGGVLAGVEIKATNQNTGLQTTTLSNDVGDYRLLTMPVGTYRIVFALPGFRTFERTDFDVSVGQVHRLDVRLEVGEVTDTVVVSANSELLSENALVSTTLQNEVITDLPLSFNGGRIAEGFAFAVTPGVEGDSWESFMGGGQAFSKEVLIDGISASAQIQGNFLETPASMEAIQEFKVQTSGMSAEYGRTSGGVFSYALKSGTNDLHGSLLYYGRNEGLNANTWMNNWNLSQDPSNPRYKRARDREFLWGGSTGGPIYIPGLYKGRDRSFFFFAIEHDSRESYQLGTLDRTVPLPAFLDGDFSALLDKSKTVGTDALGRPVYSGQIYNPATLRQEGGKWVSDPFPGNIIPKSQISPASAKIADLFRKHYPPSVNRLTNNNAGTATNSPWFRLTQYTMKGDHQITDSNRFSASVVITEKPRVLADDGGIWDPEDPNGFGGPMARARNQNVKGRRITISDNWTLKPNLINTFSAALNRYINTGSSTAEAAGYNWLPELGLGSANLPNFPNIQFGDAVNGIETTEIGGKQGGGGYYAGNTFIVSDSMDWIVGRHGLKFGGEFWHMQMNSPNWEDMPEFDFANYTTGHPGANYTGKVGFGFASFMLGAVDSGTRSVPSSLYGRRNYWDIYINDDFKVSPKLTLNFGLRWEQTLPLTEKYGNWAHFNLDRKNTIHNVMGAWEFATGPNTTFEGEKDWKEFSPRLGFAYRLKETTVIRAGYGLFFSPIGIQSWGAVPYAPWSTPDIFGTDTMASSKNLPRFSWDVSSGYPGNFKPGQRDSNFLDWGIVSYDQEALKAGYTHQWNVSVQHSITPDTRFEVIYMGNDGNRLHSGFLRRNQPRREEYEALKDPGAWIWDADSATAAGVKYPYPGFSGYAGMAITPFPHVTGCGNWGRGAYCPWSELYFVGSPLGSSSYRSLQLVFTRRMSTGLAADISYNYSKAKGNTETAFDESWDETGACSYWSACTGVQDIYNLEEAADTVVSYDQTHVLKGATSFQLPFGRGKKWLSGSHGAVDAIFGGWNLTGIFRYASGRPMGVIPAVWRPGWSSLWDGGPANGAVYADVVPGADLSARYFNSSGFNPADTDDPNNTYFDKDNFSNPTGWKLGNGKRLYDDLRGFSTLNEDIGIMKYWGIRENVRLQFRLEMLNAFNRHRFDDPATDLGNSSTYGQVLSVGDWLGPRNIQYGFRLQW